MPTLTRWFVKSALLYFVAALVVGGLLAAPGAVSRWPALGTMTPVYFHLFMVGWVTQLIIGVSLWMFPRYSKEKPRGSEVLALGTYVALNAGMLLRAVAEPMHALRPDGAWAWLLALSAGLQWLAGVLYAVNIWPRVKER